MKDIKNHLNYVERLITFIYFTGKETFYLSMLSLRRYIMGYYCLIFVRGHIDLKKPKVKLPT